MAAVIEAWKGRPVTSSRLLGTGAGIFLVGVPISLWYLVVGPTAPDRLVSLGFLVTSLVLGAYSLWEAKAPGPPDRPNLDDDPT